MTTPPMPPATPMTANLTLAVPAHNDRVPLLRLLNRVRQLEGVARVVVVDDGSDVPLETEELSKALKRPEPNSPDSNSPESTAPDSTTPVLTLLRHDTAKGPGPARNRALGEVDSDYVLFVDADDLVTQEVPLLMRDLDGKAFDFCLFRYHDTRQEQALLWGQMPWDQHLWQQAGVALGALNVVSRAARTPLVQCANYPWNKIYRTAFLRDHQIGCSGILLHEDVELHWRSFLHAKIILASDRIGVIHFVSTDGDRLTNRTGPERLEVFEPLARIAAEIEAHDRAIYALPFARFALGLIDWIGGNLDPAYARRLGLLTRGFTDAHIPPALLDDITRHDPDLIARVLRDDL